ncbi:hypothetical protein [Brevibacterium sp.]|uniref:hypothetical protein n=1 Tax=Brevibacterium sp. TaxID=1701 RepID=UPI00281282BD|nr:hypothetical protein [Brevibacterium sp.]
MTGIPRPGEKSDEQSRDLSRDAAERMLVDTSPYLSCDDCFDRLDEYVEQRIADPDYGDELMEVHLAGCEACAEEARTLTVLLS